MGAATTTSAAYGGGEAIEKALSPTSSEASLGSSTWRPSTPASWAPSTPAGSPTEINHHAHSFTGATGNSRSQSSEPSTMTYCFGCCRGFNARLLFLMACAMIEYISHTVILILGPMIALHFYPNTAFPRIGFYTALLSGSGYLGHALSCRLWINMARTLKSSKGVILWGLAIIGSSFLSLLFCQSLLAMTIVRFATGLFSGVIPVALIEIDHICGNRQSHLASSTKFLGVAIGSAATFFLVGMGNKFALGPPESDSSLFFYPLCFVSIISWVATVVTLIGLRVSSRAYLQLGGDEDDDLNFGQPHSRSAVDDSPVSQQPLDAVKSAFEETFRMNRHPHKHILMAPQPHFRTIRSIMPHYFHGYTTDGHVVIWDFLGQIKVDKLHSSGFTTADIREHYRFFLQFAVDKLLKPSQKIVYVIDLEGLTLTDADDRVVDMACSVISEIKRDFPDKLQSLAVLNAPVWFSQVMTSIRPLISRRTADKLLFFRGGSTLQDLLKLIGVDSLPKRYGGRNGVEMGKSSQERALDELLKQTTGSLEETIEIISRAQPRRGRTGSVRSDGDASDEEAFFDCSEYGLQGVEDDDDDISIVVHSQASTNSTEAIARALPPQNHKYVTMEKKASGGNGKVVKVDHLATSDVIPDIAITREPHAYLVLAIFFFWSLVQISFDEMLPLWFFKQNPLMVGRIHADPLHTTISSITMTTAGCMGLACIAVLLCQLFFCTFSSNVMTPLATYRVGLLFQIPIIGCFPLIDLFKVDKMQFAWVIVVVVIVVKHLAAGVALHGILSLLDNSIAVDRRLAVHRAAQMVSYVAYLLSSAMGPSLFALMGYFEHSFPFDQSLLYFIQGLGLIFLFLFSCLIPSRLNFPLLFAMGKR